MNCEILSDDINSKIILINDTKLQVFEDGRIYRFYRGKDLRLVENKSNDGGGYNRIGCNGKNILRHRIIAYTFLDLDINDTKKLVDHRDGQKTNNNAANLRIVTNHRNQFNRTTAKGFSWDKDAKKYRAQIGINGKVMKLGFFNTVDEARASYLSAKSVYHQIN